VPGSLKKLEIIMAAKKMRVSIQVKLILIFTIFIMIVAILMYYSSKKQSTEAMRDELSKLAVVISTQIDGDKFSSIKPGDEKTKNYKELYQKLLTFQESHPDIKHVYTFRKFDNKSVQFIVDPEYGREDGKQIGYVNKEITPEMFQGLIRPSADTKLVKDENGSILSGYAPVVDSKNNIAGAVGVAMETSVLSEKIAELARPMMITIVLAVVFALIIFTFVTMSMIKDIKKLTKQANEISMGHSAGSINIKRNDEIGELADSFSRMAASIKILMMTDEEEGGK
jgi:HAMP domain-containing protein